MQSKILDLKQSDTWAACLAEFPRDRQELFFTPGWYEAFEQKGDGKALCFVFEKEGDVALYPFLMNDIGRYDPDSVMGRYFDIEGAYGYNGVLATTASPSFVGPFQKHFLEFCRESRIVAEFTRFNPVLKNEVVSDYMKIIPVNDNIIVDLKMSEEDLWLKSYDYAVRKSVNKAKRNNLKMVVSDGCTVASGGYLEQFLSIFHSTLDRNQATPESYFDLHYLQTLNKNLGEKALYFFALLEDKAVSAELVLLSPKGGYSFLGGTLAEAYDFRPNHFLKDHLIRRLKKNGKEYYCIGGGKKRGDGIFKYKNSFATDGAHPFYIGTKVHDEATYHDICSRFAARNPEKAERNKDLIFKYKL
ncbi:MAG: GNAT family N-acetyltransferase [Deltaproteobacteria bacterium]|nr:GNAT family N-acetyltransferase [Deltaproteobacteria bacterium]